MTNLRAVLIGVGVRAPVAEEWELPLAEAAQRWGIDTPHRLIPWLANMAHESSGLTVLEENLRYSAARLLQIWPCTVRRPWGFTHQDVGQYAGRPQMIANRVYANRYGNGDEASGDGWLYRGRGPFQLTFRDNYAAAGEAVELDLEGDPELVLNKWTGAQTAGWYWSSRGLNLLADVGDQEAIRRAINGGLIGYDEVLARVKTAEQLA